MAQLIDTLNRQLGPEAIGGLAERIGADESTTSQATSMLLPLLIGALSKNSEGSEASRRSLDLALERDHDGSLLDNLGKLLGGGGIGGALGGLLGGSSGADDAVGPNTDGDGILQHVLGDRREAVEGGVAQAVGLERSQVSQLVAILAPLVMSALGKVKREQGLGESGVTDLLKRERRTIDEAAPDAGGGLLDRLLDSNRDGKIDMKDDIAKVGMALGAAFLFKRRR